MSLTILLGNNLAERPVTPELMGEADMQGKDTSPVVTEAVEAEASTPYPHPTAAPADGVLGDTEVAKGMISHRIF